MEVNTADKFLYTALQILQKILKQALTHVRMAFQNSGRGKPPVPLRSQLLSLFKGFHHYCQNQP